MNKVQSHMNNCLWSRNKGQIYYYYYCLLYMYFVYTKQYSCLFAAVVVSCLVRLGRSEKVAESERGQHYVTDIQTAQCRERQRPTNNFGLT